jgi:competence protein ComEC
MFSNFNLKKLLLGIIFTLAFTIPAFAKDLTVSYVDIGQGDSELIELPDGTNIMIDAGDKDGAPKLIDYLKERKIAKIDLVLITHPHIDHYGGLLQTMKLFPVGMVYDSGAPTTSTTYLKLLKEFAAKKVKFKITRRGDKIDYGNGISLNILAPEDPLLKNTRSDTNNASIVAKLTYNKVSFLFTGDMEEESQDRMLKSPADLQADILKVAHHGSRYTSSNQFLKAVNPKAAVISCGTGNSYGHPHMEALKRLADNNIAVYRTDLMGTIIASTDGNEYKIIARSTPQKIKKLNSKTDLNNASSEQLELLPGLNAEKVIALIKLRPVKSWEQLKTLNLTADEITQMKKQAFFSTKPVKTYPKIKKEKTITGKVDINTATMKELVALPGIGKKTAQNIINGRPYKSVNDLEKVQGIGKNRLKTIIDLFMVN